MTDKLHQSPEFAVETWIAERTPARLFAGRSGTAFRTATQLQLRADHASARDAVTFEFDLQRDFAPHFVKRWKLFEVCTRARSKTEYLLHPDLGRELPEDAAQEITSHCSGLEHPDLQIVIGDGLSAWAVATQVPLLLPFLVSDAQRRQWTI